VQKSIFFPALWAKISTEIIRGNGNGEEKPPSTLAGKNGSLDLQLGKAKAREKCRQVWLIV